MAKTFKTYKLCNCTAYTTALCITRRHIMPCLVAGMLIIIDNLNHQVSKVQTAVTEQMVERPFAHAGVRIVMIRDSDVQG